jgi:hypothetical protein
VEEEADVDARNPLAQEAWEQEKLVVMDPDNVSRCVSLDDAICKELIEAYIVEPPLRFSASIV